MSNAWTARYGSSQGRIIPSTVIPAAGDYVFCLGCEQARVEEKLAVGDYIEIYQAASVANVALVRLTAMIRPPTNVPLGMFWRFGIRVDGIEYVGRTIPQGRDRYLTDLAANVIRVSGTATIAFRLQLLGAGEPRHAELPGVYLDSLVLEEPPP